MRTTSAFFIFLLVSFAVCLPASAIVVADYSVATSAPTGSWDIDWNYVYNYQGSSGVAVGPNWLLTAAHVADDSFPTTLVINGIKYDQQEIIFHLAADDPEHPNRADLALVRFDKAFPGWYPLYTGNFPTGPFNQLNAILIGFGTTGSVFTTYYTDSWSGNNGTRRWGTQKITGPDTADYDVEGTTGMTYNEGIEMEFNSVFSGTSYEAGVGVRDSGSGTFVNDGGTWKLAGINTVRYGGPTNFTGTFAVSVPAYEPWITQTIDEITGDADADGIPNWWEEQFGTNVLAATDQDGDGFTGEEEYIADTDPTDSNSFFKMEGAISATNQTFSFDSSTARQYQLLTTTSLTNLTWITNGVPVWGEGANTEIIVTNTENTVFYRMQAILP